MCTGAARLTHGNSNYPLRGGKFSDWEGGVRVPAVIGGGYLPQARRGQTAQQMMHMTDLFATFVYLANNRPKPAALAALLHDASGELAGLPPVDSVNMWPAVASPLGKGRSVLHLSPTSLISGQFKLIVGVQSQTMWTGPVFPNATGEQPLYSPNDDFPIDDEKQFLHDCGEGCVFNIISDPTEHVDLASAKPALLKTLVQKLAQLNKGNFVPARGAEDPQACVVALDQWHGVLGPFLPDLPV